MQPDTPPFSASETDSFVEKSSKAVDLASNPRRGAEVAPEPVSPAVDIKVNTAPAPVMVERAGNRFDGGVGIPIDTPPVARNTPPEPPLEARVPIAATLDVGAPHPSPVEWHPLTLADLPIQNHDARPVVFEEETLVKADKLTLVLAAEKDGKIRLGASSWENGKVILPGEELDVRWQGGQVHLIRRKPKAD